ncbi:MAG: NfeD family protein, partial [Lachnospiraceae bacterium]|nr:NfeD family protein [Lachnospiraceae bacterium]
NVNSMIGKEGKVTEEIDNFNQKGTIVVNGLEWTARSSDDDIVIPNGAKVIVKDVQGVKAIVGKVSEQ